MPKRVVDGDSLWRSDKLALVELRWRAEYANLLPLALANGTFEANPRRIWSQVYSYNRPDVSAEHVSEILATFEQAKMLFRWADQESGKVWGYWTGIEKPGRLPSKSRLNKRHETLGPEPPADQLKTFLSSNGQPMASHGPTNGSPGFGFGSGFGLGSGKNLLSEANAPDAVKVASATQTTKKQPSDVANRLAALLAKEIHRNKADYRITQAQERKWAETADRLMNLDGRTESQIADLIRWVQHDEFETPNVLSMEKLRERFDALEMKRQRDTGKLRTNGSMTGPAPSQDYIPASVRERQERAQAKANGSGGVL